MSSGKIDADLTQEAEQIIQGALQTVQTTFPQSPATTPKEKREMVKMGPKSVDFVTTALEHAERNPDLIPPAVLDVPAWRRDTNLAIKGGALLNQAKGVMEQMDDSVTLSGSEAMVQALIYYGYLQGIVAHKPGLKSIVAELGKRFKRSGVTAKAATAAQTEPAEEAEK